MPTAPNQLWVSDIIYWKINTITVYITLNAVAERVNGILNEEYLDTQQIRYENETIVYLSKAIKLYNSERPHMSISNYTPDKVHYAKELIEVKRLWKNYYPKKKQL